MHLKRHVLNYLLFKLFFVHNKNGKKTTFKFKAKNLKKVVTSNNPIKIST